MSGLKLRTIAAAIPTQGDGASLAGVAAAVHARAAQVRRGIHRLIALGLVTQSDADGAPAYCFTGGPIEIPDETVGPAGVPSATDREEAVEPGKCIDNIKTAAGKSRNVNIAAASAGARIGLDEITASEAGKTSAAKRLAMRFFDDTCDDVGKDLETLHIALACEADVLRLAADILEDLSRRTASAHRARLLARKMKAGAS